MLKTVKLEKINFEKISNLISYIDELVTNFCKNYKDNYPNEYINTKVNDIESFLEIYLEGYEQSYWEIEILDQTAIEYCNRLDIPATVIFGIWVNQKQNLLYDYKELLKETRKVNK